MCGIAGIIAQRRATELRDVAEQMVATLRHRGPDDTGVWCADGAALACARLALVGGAASGQPICSPDGRYVLVFNGEIFNFRELRARPEVSGWNFCTEGDTEVLLALLAKVGPMRALRLLNGQFAGALHDTARRTTLLFRDRFGIQPLYYAELQRGGIAFASRLGTLAALREVDRSVDPEGLRQILAFWATVAPVTAVRGVRDLQPGGCAEHSDDALVVRSWRDSEDPPPAPGDFNDHVDALEAAVQRSLKRRLLADCSVDLLISGGVDSALLGRLASCEQSTRRSWSVRFEDPLHDESAYQRQVVAAIGSDHHEREVTANELAAALPDVVAGADCPLVRLAPAATYLLSAAIHEHGGRAVISGEGADEGFLGYDVFKEAMLLERGELRTTTIAAAGLGGTPSERHDPSVLRLMLSSGTAIDQRLATHTVRWRSASALQAHLLPGVLDTAPDPFSTLARSLPDGFGSWSSVRRAQYLETSTFLPGYLLSTQADRMLMAHSVEGRYPFLDDEVFDLALALPEQSKLSGPDDKRVLRAVAQRWLPRSIALRPKQGYRAPVDSVLRTRPGQELVDDLLAPPRIESFGVFDPKRVAWLVTRLQSGARLSNTQEMALLFVITTHLLQQRLAALTPIRKELAA
jgi:asparagine synthase (glutamine-hydrolysing)